MIVIVLLLLLFWLLFAMERKRWSCEGWRFNNWGKTKDDDKYLNNTVCNPAILPSAPPLSLGKIGQTPVERIGVCVCVCVCMYVCI